MGLNALRLGGVHRSDHALNPARDPLHIVANRTTYPIRLTPPRGRRRAEVPA